MKKNISLFRFFTLAFMLSLAACHPAALETSALGGSFSERLAENIAGHIEPGKRVAVVAFYDGDNGNYTALGNQWRDRAETALSQQVKVVARRDLGALLDEQEEHLPGFNEQELWSRSGADYLLVGRYYLSSRAEIDFIELKLKLLRVKDNEMVTAMDWQTRLAAGWQARALRITGNYYADSIEIVGPGAASRGPELKARLDRDFPCYESGSRAAITVESEAGVYIYILNVAADRTVSLIYPNSYLREKAQVSRHFRFPPEALADLVLELYPLAGEELSRESFKVIASYDRLDLSFLKVAEERIFAGAEAAELKKVLELLENAQGYSEVNLSYMVGRCR